MVSTSVVTTPLHNDHHLRTPTAFTGGVISCGAGLSTQAGEKSRADPSHKP